MYIPMHTSHKNIIYSFFVFIFCIFSLTSIVFANSKTELTNLTQEQTTQNTNTKNEVSHKLKNTNINNTATNYSTISNTATGNTLPAQNTNIKPQSDLTPNTATNNTPPTDLDSLYEYTSNPLQHYIDPNSQTQIYGGSSTIISGDTITSSHSQQQIPTINNNTQPTGINNNSKNSGINNNSQADDFYLNIEGPNGSSILFKTKLDTNSSNNSVTRKSTSRIINDRDSQTLSSGSPQQGSRIIKE